MPGSTHPSVLLPTVIAILPLFGLVATGVIARRIKLLDRSDSTILSSFVVQIALPALILSTLVTKHFVALDALLPVLMWMAEAAAIALVLGVAKIAKLDKGSIGSAILSMFGNTGFMGYPMTNALFPNELPATVFLDQLGMALPLFPGALMLKSVCGEGASKSGNVLRAAAIVLKSPMFIALASGIILRLVFVRLPALNHNLPATLLTQTVALIGSATIPVVMFAIGMRLSAGHAIKHIGLISVLGVIKLLIMPALVFVAGKYVLHLTGDLLSVCVLEAAMPPGAAGTVLAEQYRMNGDQAVATFFVLTLASGITIPLLMSILR